ncbi:MAG: DPP IV N-terminal domain-containing protein [Longimicrobiales bacterium]
MLIRHRRRYARALSAAAALSYTLAGSAAAQGSAADYTRAQSVRTRLDGLVVDLVDTEAWIGNTSRFWYRKSITGGTTFMIADAATLEKKPAFDHTALAASLATATGRTIDARVLPFNELSYAADERSFEITVDTLRFTCTVVESRCTAVPTFAGRGGRGGRGGGGGTGRFGGGLYGDAAQPNPAPRGSPDGKTEAVIRNFNVFTRAVGTGDWTALSTDGSDANAYVIQSLSWSPDSKKLAAYRVKPGFTREVHYVMSSPEDQIQPKDVRRLYNKPGDVLDVDQPVLFDLAARKQIEISSALFPNAYEQSGLVWRADSRAFTFEYNQRGHQVYRVVEVDGNTGATRAIISEEPRTFFTYSSKRFRFDVNDGAEIIWMSERDGWNHLYLFDGATGRVKNPITRGPWVVRGVDRVDAAARQIWFRASGMVPGKDPYFIHHYRINFDGTGLTTFTEADATHTIRFSGDGQYYLDRYSRVDLPPVLEVRRTNDQKLVLMAEKANASALLATGWRPPEAFVSKARDGTTDIYGIIVRPTNFNPGKKYPVIEYIYAGPHDSFVPKSWGVQYGMQAQAELGFIVAQIDGMGTSNRSKAFHDVSWQNIGDAGFPDRKLWHKAVAAQYAWYDVSKVGIYGGSAGGQNAMGALLFHPEFYKVAVSFAGCHDNRMDKIWWNEQWMGWPLAPHYDASSNVVNAHRLQGKLLLLVGELDENVDPSSTFQVANALVKANKTFDLFVFPGGDHGVGRRGTLAPYGDRKQWDYFVHHLLGVEPPDWNAARKAADSGQ